MLWLLAACIGVQAITTPEGVRQIPVSPDIAAYIQRIFSVLLLDAG